MSFILGQKIGMTRIYDKAHQAVPVTVVLALPNKVVQVKSVHSDGYTALQVGAHDANRHMTKPLTGHTKAAKMAPKLLREYRVDKIDHSVGDSFTVEQFKADDVVKVTGTTKGKGFAGVIKRHGFHRGPETHGSDHHRAPGSIGAQQPQRVVKGKKMPGHMGHVISTMIKVKVVDVIKDDNLILLRGALPGPNKGWLTIKN
ncbi:MAG TPA: 50S ribosomal protein L3 [Patescibacteria group bacterium]|nr:50S ribosomal protein L3 [Patescibacteria group bacterium]